MTNNSLQGHVMGAPLVYGAPGPPHASHAPATYWRDEDDVDMFSVHGNEPDDLGDLMREMREGGAWADSLAMDGSDAYAGAGGVPTAAAFGGPSVATAGGGYDLALATLTQQQGGQQMQGQRRAAEEQERATPPSVAALLMHPGGRGSGASGAGGMIPIVQEQPRLSAAASLALVPDCGPAQSASASLQQTRIGGGGNGSGWPGMQQQPLGGYPIPPQCPSAFAFYQPTPGGFMGSHPMAPPQHAQSQQQRFGSGAARTEPHSSGDASDNTTLQRRSFESDDRSHNRQHVFQPQLQQPHQQQQQAQAQQQQAQQQQQQAQHVHQRGGHHQHQQPAQAHRTHLASAAPAQQLCSAHALAAFDQAAASDCQAGSGGPASASAPLPSLKCEAPSDSSDAEDFAGRRSGSLRRQDSHLQVVPDALCYAGQSSGHHYMAAMPQPQLAPHSVCAMQQQHSGGASLVSLPHHATHHHQQQHSLPSYNAYYGSPAAQTARMARLASLERYRLKKARRGFGKKIRYQARKVNADKRPRVKGRFVKAGEAAVIVGVAGSSGDDTSAAGPEPCVSTGTCL